MRQYRAFTESLPYWRGPGGSGGRAASPAPQGWARSWAVPPAPHGVMPGRGAVCRARTASSPRPGIQTPPPPQRLTGRNTRDVSRQQLEPQPGLGGLLREPRAGRCTRLHAPLGSGRLLRRTDRLPRAPRFTSPRLVTGGHHAPPVCTPPEKPRVTSRATRPGWQACPWSVLCDWFWFCYFRDIRRTTKQASEDIHGRVGGVP